VKISPRQFLIFGGVATILTIIVMTLSGPFDPSAWWNTKRTIKVIVGFPAGGTTDILARLLGEQISKMQHLTVIIENRPGAGSSIALEAIARAAPDGNTVAVTGNALVINPYLRHVNYDPLTSFKPICSLVRSPQVFVVNTTSPYGTLNEFLTAARTKPGELTLASVGAMTTQHIRFEQFKRIAKVDIMQIPFPGATSAVSAVLGEHVTSLLANYSEVAEELKAGKLRALAVASRERIEQLPDVPTIAQSGYRDFQVEVWLGLLAPPDTPDEMVAQLEVFVTAAIEAPELGPQLVKLGFYPFVRCGEAFSTHIREQYKEYGRAIQETN
jgi:tripartite-type tricarboxylate transporter receptor subunit TctC